MFKPIFDQFVVEAPIAVIARSIMEHLLNSEQLDEWFDQAAKEQYTRNLLFSSIFDIMTQVVLGSRPSVHAAYQASEEKVGVTITSVYNKINGIEPNVSNQLSGYVGLNTIDFIINRSNRYANLFF